MTTLRSYGYRTILGLLVAMCPACATNPVMKSELSPPPQKSFDSPDEAMKALLEATQADDKKALREMFGPKIKELKSGDDVQDARDFEEFARRLARASRLVREGENKAIIHLGVEDYPFAVPLVRANGKWSFDTAAGMDELLNRRIGENEIQTARLCRGYVAAQQEYVLEDHDGDDVLEYAQRLASAPGKQDGLYWETTDDEPPSPLGPLAAEARAAGYGGKGGSDAGGPRPYHGYLYKILTRQGAHAPGSAFNYVINGNMVAGFALLAYPVAWGSSGVMTFIVNSNGKVFQKNLGEKTASLAVKIDAYDPDDSWTTDKD